MVHHSHESCLLRGIVFCGKCGACSKFAPKLLTKACKAAQNARNCVEAHCQRPGAWTEPFRGHCGHCWKWGHKKAQCHQWQGRRPVELGAMASCPSQSVMSDPRYSVSQRAQAVTSSPVQLACWPIAADVEEDCPEEWCYDWESDRTEDWHDDWSCPTPEEQSSEWHDDEGCYLVCGVAGSNRIPKQNVDKVNG